MTAPVHRENLPPLDLAPIVRRIKERRVYTSASIAWKETIDADTEMLEQLVTEVRRVRLANDSLRAALGPGRRMPVAE